jgi:[acyl-carrier-protein] S-malonyltransferase
MTLAFIFPGQGVQKPGMGKSLFDAFGCAREVFQEVDDALGERLSKLIFEGPAEDLTLTSNTQPALFAVSLAAMRVLEREFGTPVTKAAYVAGHSLGEYSALAAAGAFSIADAARLLRARGRAMLAAFPPQPGVMAALLRCGDMAAVEAIVAEANAQKAGLVAVANDNNEGNVIISGEPSGVAAAVAVAKAKGGRGLPLNVTTPFHSPLMAPAAEAMREALAEAAIAPLAVPLVANVIAQPVSEPARIRELLVEQIAGRVRWRESTMWMAAEDGGAVTRFAEVGVGDQLTGMVKRNAPGAEAIALNEPAELESFAKTV